MSGTTLSAPVLSVACACGRRDSAPCPSLRDIPAAQAKFAGWSYDAHGRIRCPDCTARDEAAAQVTA